MSKLVEVTSWLKSGEERFARKLEEIGIRRGYGRQTVVDGKTVTFDEGEDGGEHTGYGLCDIATGAIEEATRRRFGDAVETNGAVIAPVRRDTRKPDDFLHEVLRIADEDGNSVTVDATLRQLDFEKKNGIHIFPTSEEVDVYFGGREISTRPQGDSAREARKSMGRGRIRGLGEKDFDDLVKILLE